MMHQHDDVGTGVPGSLPTPHADRAALDRRQLLTRAGVAGGVLVWTAPTIDSFLSAAAAQGTADDPTATTNIWKWNNNPPTTDAVCSGAAAGNANRGSVVFTRVNSTNTLEMVITITSGPTIPTREVVALQSDAAGNCLAQTVAVPPTFGAPNNTPATFTVDIVAGATHFALVLLETGGGGTDTYTTTRVNLV
jgi:hypothetical protein